MKKSIAILTVSLIALISAQSLYAREIFEEKRLDKRIDEFVKSIMDEFQIPGLAMAVVKDNRVYKEFAYGVKNLATKVPLTVESVFHMASVSKPFSATAIMQLVEKGKINLDDPLIKYLPYFKMDDPRYQEITIKQMLTHTSGIPDENDYEWDKPQYDAEAAERYVRSLVGEKMIAAPGEKYRYSNMAFDILADVIAKVSGVTFEDYVKQKILDPLGMKDSDFLRERIRPELQTSGHVFNLKPRVSEVYPYNRRHAPSSCLNASIREMCNWAQANMNGGAYKGKRILEKSSYEYLFEPQVRITENRSIGLSWYIDQHRNNKTISHGGKDVGYTSFMVMLPEKSLAVIAAINFDGEPIILDITFGVVDIMLGFEPTKPKIPIYIIVSKAILDSGIGKAIEQYRALKKYQPDRYIFRESQLNWLGHHLIDNNRLNDGIEIFKLNVEMFPQSFNSYNSLGEAYLKAGNREFAIANYEKSLILNPKNNKAREQIERLQQKK